MVAPAAGAVVLVPFPFSDLTQSRLRPAVVLADVGRGDRLLCQITSNPYSDPYAVVLTNADFQAGSLHLTSYARPGKLFTASQTLLVAVVGQLTDEAFVRVINAVIDLLRDSLPP
jgi:mRNA interferase MazF